MAVDKRNRYHFRGFGPGVPQNTMMCPSENEGHRQKHGGPEHEARDAPGQRKPGPSGGLTVDHHAGAGAASRYDATAGPDPGVRDPNGWDASAICGLRVWALAASDFGCHKSCEVGESYAT